MSEIASVGSNPMQSQPIPIIAGAMQSTRFFALDSLRAAAMLLGVWYHAVLFGGGGMFGGGMPGGPAPNAWEPARLIMDWSHSFRMPLFFLISGFFCHMMRNKYGLWGYLARRLWRIGIPFLVALFIVGLVHEYVPSSSPFGGGRGPGRRGPGGPGPGGPPPFSMDNPPPFVPPPLEEFDKDGDGEFSNDEWKEARAQIEKDFGPPASRDPQENGGPPNRGGPPGIEPGFNRPPDFGGPPGFPPQGFPPPGGPGVGRFGGMPPRMPGMFAPGPLDGLGQRLFGDFARNLGLGHLWFLWYLLVFAVAAPLCAGLLRLPALIAPQPLLRWAGAFHDGALRWGFAPGILAAIAFPFLLSVMSFGGWGMGPAMGVMQRFPDMLGNYLPDWPYYFCYFMAGWFLFGSSHRMPWIAKTWLPCLTLGLLAYGVNQWLSSTYSSQFGIPHYEAFRLTAMGCLALSCAMTSWGFLGFFQRFLDRPTWLGRYLADTAFWIYLVHQDLLIALVLPWVRGWKLSPFPQAVCAVAITTLIAIVSFEVLVRHTPLRRLFGPTVSPASKRR